MKALLTTALLFISSLSWSFSYTVEISEQQIQQKIDALMPLERKKLFFLVTLSDAKVDLVEGKNEISLFSQVRLDAPNNIRATGRAEIAGTLIYKAKEGAFYLNNPQIKQIEIDQLDPGLMPTMKKLAQNAVAKSLVKQPVYTLNDQDLKQKLAKSMLKSINVENQILKATLSAF